MEVAEVGWALAIFYQVFHSPTIGKARLAVVVVEQRTYHQAQPLVLLWSIVGCGTFGIGEELVAHAPRLEESESSEANLSARRFLFVLSCQHQHAIPLTRFCGMLHAQGVQEVGIEEGIVICCHTGKAEDNGRNGNRPTSLAIKGEDSVEQREGQGQNPRKAHLTGKAAERDVSCFKIEGTMVDESQK